MGQRPIERQLRDLELRWRRPELRFRPRFRFDRQSVISGKEPRLQFSDRIPAVDFRQSLAIRQVLLESSLVESFTVERTELRGQPAKRPDKAELRRDLVDDETEPNLLG